MCIWNAGNVSSKSLVANGSDLNKNWPDTATPVRACYWLCAEQLGHHGLKSEDDNDPRSQQHIYIRMKCTTVHSDEGICRWSCKVCNQVVATWVARATHIELLSKSGHFAIFNNEACGDVENGLDWAKMNCTGANEHAVAVINTTCDEWLANVFVASVLSKRRSNEYA